MKRKVLFVCIHNSARSQMAEAFLNAACPELFQAQSAGLEPGNLNPLVIAAMKEIGFDLSRNRAKGVAEFLERRERFDHVIAVCDGASAERCPLFPSGGERLHWSFPDPSTLTGSEDERLRAAREIRDAIRARVQQWCDQMCVAAGK